MKYLSLMFWLMAITINLLASEERVTLKGPFIVCSDAHFLHATCFAVSILKGGKQECPVCRDNTLVKVVNVVFKKDRSEYDVCSICLEDYAVNPKTGVNKFRHPKS